MAFARPTLQELIDRARSDIRSELGTIALVRRTFLATIARVQAGVGHSLHGHLKEISKQAFPDQATGNILARWGAIYDVPRRAATFANLTIAGTGTDGSTIPVGTVFQIDSGETYISDAEVTIASGVYSVNITAENAGSQTNLADGENVALQNPISGVDAEALVSATVTEGEDLETEENWQLRIVARIQNPPAGGKATDYIAFALSVAGVSRAWVFPGNRGQGTVDVSFLELDGGDEVIPSGAKVAEVQAVVNEEKPATADSIVFAPTALTVDFDMAIKPNTSAVQAAVTAEIEDLFKREAEIAGSLDITDVGGGATNSGKVPLSKVNEAISIAADEEDHVLNSPAADIEPTQGQISTVGTITFSTLA